MKEKLVQGTAIWINEVGAIKPRVFSIIKVDEIKKTIIISFNKKEVYEIDKNNLRANRLIIFQKSNGKIFCQNPDKIGQLDLDKKGIKTLRFNLQNSALQESKSAIYRWTLPKNAIDKLAPMFKILFIGIAIGVLGWSALKYTGVVLDLVSRSRLMDCASLIPKLADPINAISNMTSPVGV